MIAPAARSAGRETAHETGGGPQRRPVALITTISAAGFLLSLAQSLRGGTRSYNYDESVTVGFFVDAEALAGFTQQRVANNHPLFSVLEQVIWRLGAQTELAMRLLPAGCTAATVAAIAWWTGRRWGPSAAVAAALVLLTNPMFVSYGQQVRGYSLFVLAAAISTIALIEIESRPADDQVRYGGASYVIAAAVGLATHLYMLPVLAGHFLLVVTRQHFSLVWLRRWGVVGAVGAVAYMGAMPERRPGSFRPGLPWETTTELLGGTPASIAILGLASLAALWVHRRYWALVAAPVAFVGYIWLVAQPLDLYARFFVWIVPAVAVAAAWATARRPVALVLVAVAAASAWPIHPPAEQPIREAAAVLTSDQGDGLVACAVGSEALAAYTKAIPEFTSQRGCDVVAAIGSWHPAGFAEVVETSSAVEDIKGIAVYRIPPG